MSCASDPHYPYPDEWCGNCGWMPFYPFLIYILKLTGINTVLIGFLLSAVFHFLFIFLLYAVLLKSEFNFKSCMVLLAAAFFFGSIYYHAVFPVSMFLFFVLLMIKFVRENRITAASVSGGLAAFTYSSGIWLAAVMALFLVYQNRKSFSFELFKKILFSCLLIASGFMLVMLIHKISVGRWDAFFLVQHKYGHGINIPTKYISRNIAELFNTGINTNDFRIACQTSGTLVLMILILIMAVVKRNGTYQESSVYTFILIYVLVFYLMPLTMGKSISLYRAESLLLPGVLFIKDFPKWISIACVLALIIIAFHMNILFFKSILV